MGRLSRNLFHSVRLERTLFFLHFVLQVTQQWGIPLTRV